MTEYQAESTFKHYSYFYGGARHTCYTSIAAAGSSGSIFHYGHAGQPTISRSGMETWSVELQTNLREVFQKLVSGPV